MPNEPPESGGVSSRSFAAGQAERGGGDRVQRERPLEVRPRGQRPARLPASRRRRRSTRPACTRSSGTRKRLADDEVGRARAPRRRRRSGTSGRGRRLGSTAATDRARLERVVVDRDQLGCVLGDVAVAATTTASGSPDVARGADGGRVERARATSMPAGNGRDSAATSSPVSTPTTPGQLERRGRIDRRRARARAASARSPRDTRAEPARGRR